jgi:hypothetical protein
MSRWVVDGEDHVPRTMRPRSLDQSTLDKPSENQRCFAGPTLLDRPGHVEWITVNHSWSTKRSDFPHRNDDVRRLEARFVLFHLPRGTGEKSCCVLRVPTKRNSGQSATKCTTAKWDERGKSKLFDIPHSALSRLRPLRIDRPSQSVDSSKGSQRYYP